MKPSTELHQLIRSMSMSEKRYFKIHASRHIIGDANNYTRLFDAVEAQEKYDEEKLKKLFAGEKFIRHLPSEKHYLYERVLESLTAGARHKSFLARQGDLVAAIELLYNRGLFSQCKRIIKLAKKEAYSLERLPILYQLVHWETVLFIHDEDEKNIRRSISEELRLIESLHLQTQLMRMAFDIQIRIDKGHADPDYVTEMKSQLRKVYPPPESLGSFWTHYYFFSGMALLYTIENNNRARYRCYDNIKNLMDSSPQFIRDLPAIYHLNYNNLVNIALFLKRYEQAEKLLHEQRNVLPRLRIRNQNLETRILLNTYESELYLNYKTLRWQKAAEIARSLESAVKKVSADFGPVLYDLIYFMAISELMIKNYKAAAKWVNRILQAEEKVNLRREIQINARLLYLVILFESGDVLYASRLKATKRFLQQPGRFVKQLHLLRGIEIAGDDLSVQRNRQALKTLIQLVKKKYKVASEELLNKNFDFVEWLEKQLQQATSK